MKALLWMSGALASFSLMAVGARELDDAISVFQTLLVRSAIGLPLVGLLLWLGRRVRAVRDGLLRQHLLRNVFHFGGQYGWFVGIGLLPLAEVFALEFTVPVWTALFATLFLGERLTRGKLIAIALGLLGVLIIVQPGRDVVSPAAFIVLASALCYAIAHTTTKSLSGQTDELVILFYMCLVQLPIGLVFALGSWQWPNGVQWAWLVSIAVTALSAHYCMTRALQCAEVTTIVALDFLRLPLIAIVGVLLYDEALEVALFVGATLMVLGNFINLRQGSRA